jgi:hypothetical protein
MGDKTPSSTDCTHLVVKIKFPQHTMKQLHLDVTKNKLRAESETMYGSGVFPHVAGDTFLAGFSLCSFPFR